MTFASKRSSAASALASALVLVCCLSVSEAQDGTLRGQYIVKLSAPASQARHGNPWSNARAFTAAVAPSLQQRTGASQVVPIFPGMLRVSGDSSRLLEQLQSDHEVEYVEVDKMRHASRPMTTSRRSLAQSASVQPIIDDVATKVSCDAQSGATWGIDRIDQADLPLDNTYGPPDCMCGEGTHIWVLDTGIKITHNEFTGRMGVGKSFIYDTPSCACTGPDDPSHCPDQDCDVNGHGTHCAGTAAGTTFGVAKCATVHAVKVLDDDARGWDSEILEGIAWVVDQGMPNSVISMSLYGSDTSYAFEDAIDDALDAGIITVVAAGNEASDACNYWPGHVSSAVTVGATMSDDARWDSSNYGTCVDIFAPGTDITSAGVWSNDDEAVMSGTSMACPHVSGAAALLLAKRQSNKSPALVINALIRAFAVEGRVSDPGHGSPNYLLNLNKYNSDLPMPPPPPP
eukprot:CAMPEP_0197856054 /NCGR_PEP_ID=MMETSP1438-20131217/27798_1 /TAXON_ID=1461541 /ORGANISM="Pterosperma sp., Strain CCMP1384" /LENGTH=457 /DNA_ID=CAMNT_0043471379 /DNA_START=69 /DNA_END=1439 /DNA_ORIENTATION=+